MAHWRTMMQSENFCAADLWDDAKSDYRKAIFKITKVAQGTVVGQKGRKKGMPFLWLEDESGKAQRAPFGCNVTNATTISTVIGTPDAKRWPGNWIGMYVTKVDAADGPTDAIRIHPKAVTPKQKGQQPASAAPAETPPQEPAFDSSDVQAEDQHG